MKEPLISILIPVYNGANYLASAIKSALDQTYKNIEIIVINDGSNDNGETEKIAHSFNDIRYFSKENGGVASALNFGILNSRGEYISWLSHDDLYLPKKIESQVRHICKYDENTIFSSNYSLIDENSSHISDIDSDYSFGELPYKLLLQSFLNGCTLLIPKKAFYEVGFFDIALKTTQDYHLWFQFMKKYQFINIQENLVYSRQHSGQDSKKKIYIALKERKHLEQFILSIFPMQELRTSAGSSMPLCIFSKVLRLRLEKYRLLGLIGIVLNYLGIYNFVIKIYKRITY